MTLVLFFFVLIQYQSVTDEQSDRQTDGWMEEHLCCSNTSAFIACYATAANGEVKTSLPEDIKQ